MQAKEVARIKGIYSDVLHNNGIELVEGWATFQDGHTVSILNADGDIVRTLTAANVLLATGGLPRKLEIPGADLAITSDEALALPTLPGRLAIIGGGRVAVEMAGIFAGMGSEVHMVYRKDLPLAGACALGRCHLGLLGGDGNVNFAKSIWSSAMCCAHLWHLRIHEDAHLHATMRGNCRT